MTRAPSTDSTIPAAVRSRSASSAARAASDSASGRSGSRSTERSSPSPPSATSPSAAGPVVPPGTLNGSSTRSTPSTTTRLSRAARIDSTRAGSLSLTRSTSRVSPPPVSALFLQDLLAIAGLAGHGGIARGQSREEPSPTIPSAVVNPSMASVRHAATKTRGRRAVERPRAASRGKCFLRAIPGGEAGQDVPPVATHPGCRVGPGSQPDSPLKLSGRSFASSRARLHRRRRRPRRASGANSRGCWCGDRDCSSSSASQPQPWESRTRCSRPRS